MQKPNVSIIVPVFNTPKNYLQRCVQSLIKQSYENIEIILVDDGSLDECSQLCDSYREMDSRIRVFHKENGGLSSSRNVGIKNARGEYLCFVDSDDYVELSLVEKTYRIAKQKDTDIVIFSNYDVKTDGEKIKNEIKLSRNYFSGKQDIQELLKMSLGPMPSDPRYAEIPLSPWGRLYKRKLFTNNNIMFKSERDLIYEDLMLLLDLFPFITTCYILNEPLYNYCSNPDSLTRSKDSTRFARIQKQYFYLKNNEPYKSLVFNNPELLLRLKRTMQNYTYNSINQHVRRNNLSSSLIFLSNVYKSRLCKEIFFNYPVNLLPFKSKIYSICIKKKLFIPLIILIKLKK